MIQQEHSPNSRQLITERQVEENSEVATQESYWIAHIMYGPLNPYPLETKNRGSVSSLIALQSTLLLVVLREVWVQVEGNQS